MLSSCECVFTCVCEGQSEEQGEGHAAAVVHGQEDPGGRAGRALAGYHHQENGEQEGENYKRDYVKLKIFKGAQA